MLEIGSLVDGKYKILNKIGQGGMSVVYLAMNERANKQWAIKEVRKDGVQNFEVVKQGLIAETEMLKKLSHPNLPSIIDVIDGDGTFLIVMDYIEGRHLESVAKEYGAQSQEDVIEWAKQLCDVLSYLHSRKPPIIYRDMKPSNVMLKPDGKVMLIDFGTAREFKENSVADTTCLGTQGYAAPEQYGGHGQTDARTDIYCLGATLYHLLTGHNPSEPPYEMYPIRYWNPDLSSGLEEIILKCTQKNPDRRYQNMAQLIEDLKRSLLDPQGNFVNLSPLSAHAQTVQVTDSDRKQLNQTAQRQRYQEEDEEDEDYRQGSGDEEDEDDDAVSSKLEKAITIGGFLIGAVIVVILIIVIGNMTGLFNRNRTHDSSSNSAVTSSSSSQQVEVPDFLGSTLEEAQEEAERYNLTVEQAGTEASDEYEAGQILSQDPKEGTSVEEGSVVRVTVSSGPETVYANVPAGIVGASQSEAEQAIRAAGLVPQAQNASSDSVKIGYVISVDPGEGAQVEEGSSVTIVVSTGPEETPEPEVTVKIPDLIGWSQEEAIWALEDQGLNYTVVEGYDATLHIGDVIDMDPGVGEEVPEGTTVTLTINTEEASGEWVCQSNLVPPSGVDPDAIGYVTLTLSQAGYEDKVVYEGPNPWAGGEDYSGENITGQPGVTAGVITAELEDGTVYTYEVAFAPE